MEKTKFEKECADMCADCHAKGLDICREDADTVQPMFRPVRAVREGVL